MVLVKRGKVFHLLILRKIEQENVIDDILDRKKAFLDNKNIKNWFFCVRNLQYLTKKKEEKKIARMGRKKGGKGKINGCTQFYIGCFGDFGQKSFTARRAVFGGSIFTIQLYKFYEF